MKSINEKTTEEKSCNCRKPIECPLDKKCLTRDVVYKADVEIMENQKVYSYIGMTATTFKERYRNHVKSFNDIKYKANTELSKFIWSLKQANTNYKIHWSILSKSNSIKAGGRCCN